MTENDPVQTADFELPVRSQAVSRPTAAMRSGAAWLPESILARNVLWFCKLRWVVVGMLVIFGGFERLKWLTDYLGMRPPGPWPFVAAGILVLCNVAYLAHARYRRSSLGPNGSVINLWAQIVLDLLVLTAVVHFLGSVRTYVPFAFLFHIVISCVFFPPRQSLAVVILASILFGACITVENLGPPGLGPVYIFIGEQPVTSRAYALSFPSAVGVWLGVWYLASFLSQMVRVRDAELAEANYRLVAAQEERSRHMLTMTHQLKAPFAAIHANAQLLLKGHCGELSEEAMNVSRRIAARSRRLATEIKEMLQLANLNSDSRKPLPSVELCVSDTLRWCVEQVSPLAQERRIVLDVDIHPAQTVGVEDHLKMLFGNILANAVLYSHEGGRVGVQCRREKDSRLTVRISDEGIGIPGDKLPHIFDEHYRTKEAVRHNKESSGLGLSIVRHVAEIHGINLHVQSRPGRGTTFTVKFPFVMEDLSASERKETENGLSVNH